MHSEGGGGNEEDDQSGYVMAALYSDQITWG